MIAVNKQAFAVVLLTIIPTSCWAQAAPPTTRSSAEIERQMGELKKELDASKLAEAKAAIAEEAAIAAQASAATTKADKARLFLASVGEAVPEAPKADTADPTQSSTITTTTQKPDGTKVVEVKPYSQAGLADNKTGTQVFGGIEFGVGIAFSYDLGENRRVKEASVVDGIVRVDRTDDVRARLILESHYLFTPNDIFGVRNIFGVENTNQRKNWGVGPFVALQPGSDNIIDAIGAGFMLAMRRPGDGTDSFNIGIGVLYDIDANTLGDGIVANKPLPGSETTVRLKRQEQSGLLLMSSYSF
jgi:hypothetical protein